jgi:plasmid stabilization system protein ParE
MSRIVVRDDAAQELAAARDFYDANRPGYGSLFADAVDHAFGLLVEYPLIGSEVRPRVRRLALHGWPYAIIYFVRDDAVVIIAIAHTSRRPNYWRTRLP